MEDLSRTRRDPNSKNTTIAYHLYVTNQAHKQISSNLKSHQSSKCSQRFGELENTLQGTTSTYNIPSILPIHITHHTHQHSHTPHKPTYIKHTFNNSTINLFSLFSSSHDPYALRQLGEIVGSCVTSLLVCHTPALHSRTLPITR